MEPDAHAIACENECIAGAPPQFLDQPVWQVAPYNARPIADGPPPVSPAKAQASGLHGLGRRNHGRARASPRHLRITTRSPPSGRGAISNSSMGLRAPEAPMPASPRAVVPL